MSQLLKRKILHLCLDIYVRMKMAQTVQGRPLFSLESNRYNSTRVMSLSIVQSIGKNISASEFSGT